MPRSIPLLLPSVGTPIVPSRISRGDCQVKIVGCHRPKPKSVLYSFFVITVNQYILSLLNWLAHDCWQFFGGRYLFWDFFFGGENFFFSFFLVPRPLIPWCPGHLVRFISSPPCLAWPWSPGPLVLWSPGPLVPCSSGLLVPWSSVLFRFFFSNLSFALVYYQFHIFTLSCVC